MKFHWGTPPLKLQLLGGEISAMPQVLVLRVFQQSRKNAPGHSSPKGFWVAAHMVGQRYVPQMAQALSGNLDPNLQSNSWCNFDPYSSCGVHSGFFFILEAWFWEYDHFNTKGLDCDSWSRRVAVV